MRKFNFALALIMGFVMSGCASDVQRTVNLPATVSVKTAKVIYVSLTPASTVTTDSDYTNSMAEFRSTLNQKVEQAFPGTNVVFSAPPPGRVNDQEMSITVLDFRYVSGAGRFWAGILVGHARLQVRVQLIDLRNGNMLEDTTFGTSSSSGAGIFGATTTRQIEGVSEAIVNMLGGNASSSPPK